MDEELQEMEKFFLGEKKFQDKYILEKDLIEDEEVNSKIYHQYLRTVGNNKLASVVIIHGLNEHSTVYMKFAMLLADQNFNVHFYDWRSQGYSSGGRDTVTLKSLYEDFFSVLSKVRKDLPLFVIGHSMGGGTILSLLLKNSNLNISGVILSNPFIQLDTKNELKITLAQKFIFKIMPQFMDEFKISTRCSPHMVAHGQEQLGKLFVDPLFPRQVGIRVIKTCMVMEKSLADKRYKNFNYPALFMLGSKDRMTRPQLSHAFCKKKQFKDLTIKEIPEGYHNMFNDEEREEVAEEVVNWMKQKLVNAEDFDFPNQVNMDIPTSKSRLFMKIVFIGVILFIIKKKRPEFFQGLAWTLGIGKKL